MTKMISSIGGSRAFVVAKPSTPTVPQEPDFDSSPGESNLGSVESPNMQLSRLHQYMKGYYRAAIALLILGGVAGGFVGFKSGKKFYASSGIIRVMPVVPRVLYQTDENQMMPMFDSFVDSQAALLQDQRVLNQAMMDPEWQALGRGTSDRALEDFAKEITVTHEGEILRVQAVDPDPNAATVNVKTLIAAYVLIYGEFDNQSDEHRIELLRARVTRIVAELGEKRDAIRAIAANRNSDNLNALFDYQLQRVNKLQTELDERQLALSELTRRSSTTQPTTNNQPLTEEQLALLSPQLAAMLQKQAAGKHELAAMKLQFGEKHPSYIAKAQDVEIERGEIAEFEDRLRSQHLHGGGTLSAPNGDLLSAQELSDDVAALSAQIKTMKEDLSLLGKDKIAIDDLRAEAEELQTERDEAQHRIEALTVEAPQVTGRINVISTGDRPLAPYKDTRISYAAAGGFGGGMFGFALVAAIAFLDSRLRNPGQAEGGRFSAPMLGMLPRLPDDLADPEQAALAAHCVHEIRTLLQIWSRSNRHRVFAITSPNPGAGKTSLTLALGASYATANLRTLVVDCDLVGAGLTRRTELMIKRMLGQILLRKGLITEDQLAQAVALSGSSGKQIGQVLLDLGILTDQDLAFAVASQSSEPVGLLDAMHGVPIDQCVAQTTIPNLQILPIGAGTARDVPLLSPEALHTLVQTLGNLYDVVLIDTGPILGSLEASLLAGTVDGVVLTVRKGDRRPLVERAMSQLVTVGARVAGLVFNGASSEDISTYGRASSARSKEPGDAMDAGMADISSSNVPCTYGPLITAVTSRAPAKHRNSA